MEDVVNHPHHYADSCSLECIDVMFLMFGRTAVCDFCVCNAFKYLWRYKNKNGQEDLQKAEWYIKTAHEYGYDSDVLTRLEDMIDDLKLGW